MTSRDIWAPLAEQQQPQSYPPGRLIYLQDTQALQFYYIRSGTVKCFISSPEGDERTLTLHHAGDLIGEAAFFDRQPRVSSAVAVTRCELVAVDRSRLDLQGERDLDYIIETLTGITGKLLARAIIGQDPASVRREYHDILSILRRGMEKRPGEAARAE